MLDFFIPVKGNGENSKEKLVKGKITKGSCSKMENCLNKSITETKCLSTNLIEVKSLYSILTFLPAFPDHD